MTWHPAAVRAGLRGSLGWDARSDTASAVESVACHAVGDAHFREQKELLRSR